MSRAAGPSHDAALEALRAYAAHIGNDASLVQGAGGNVSLKDGETMWVKASGTWLAQAQSREIMVPVSLATLDLDAEDTSPFVLAGRNPHKLRPSIETSMHAALPWRVVVHVHCVETIAWAVRADAEAALAAKLSGLNWRFVPYVRPGPPLTRAIAARLGPATDVVVLGNHGLVVGADSVAAAAKLVAAVQQRLRLPARGAPARGDGACPPGYRFADDPATHATALDPLRLAVARRGSFYPDHVIFLGPGVSADPDGRPMLVVPGVADNCLIVNVDGTPLVASCAADAELVVIAGSEGDRRTLKSYRAELAPLAAHGVPAICLNPDRTMLTPDGPAFGAGRIAEEYAALGGSVTWVGKPFAPIYDEAFAELPGLARSRVGGIGDSVEHDIAGARAAGCRAILVRQGIAEVASDADIEAECRRCDAWPDATIAHFAW